MKLGLISHCDLMLLNAMNTSLLNHPMYNQWCRAPYLGKHCPTPFQFSGDPKGKHHCSGKDGPGGLDWEEVLGSSNLLLRARVFCASSLTSGRIN